MRVRGFDRAQPRSKSPPAADGEPLQTTESVELARLLMEFEVDPEKSKKDKKRHGIDFVEAQAPWDDPDFIEIPAKTTDEPRFLVIGRIGDRHWSGIITYRGEKVRIISVRRSRREEVEIYEG